MRALRVLLLLVCLIAFSCGKREADPQPEPDALPPPPYPIIRSQEFRGEKNFAKLINEFPHAQASPTPWAGYWWPYAKNGIAVGSFGIYSPAGKYDAARGGTTQAQAWEIVHHGSRLPRLQSWWGHCNGWCAASALFREPIAPVTVNGIQFGIADIKALLTEAGMSVNADFFGERLDVDTSTSPKYWDTVPDQYFLVLTNYMGRQKKTVLIDRYTGSQIWNQPVAAYRFEYPKPSDYLGTRPEAPNVHRILLTSTIWWMDDGVQPDVITPPFEMPTSSSATDNPVVQSRTLHMEVWLDGPVIFDSDGKITSSGNVVVAREGEFIAGGAWQTDEGFYVDAWPDYMWVPYAVIPPTDPEQDFSNPEVDINWLRKHLLAEGGLDDPSVTPAPIVPAPAPPPTATPTPSIRPSFPPIVPPVVPTPNPPPNPPGNPPIIIGPGPTLPSSTPTLGPSSPRPWPTI